MKIKNSFIKKLFFSLIMLYIVVFVIMAIFQGVFFRVYYSRNTVAKMEEEISKLVSKSQYDDLELEALLFSRDTQTLTVITPLNEIQNNFDVLDLIELEVENNNETIKMMIPNTEETSISIGDDIVATTVLHNNSIHLPIYLTVNDNILINSRIEHIESTFEGIIQDVDRDSQYQVNGVVTKIIIKDGESNTLLNPIVSSEILNIVTRNYITYSEFDNGFYYQTSDTNSLTPNLVFFSMFTIDGEPHILISVYKMTHVDQIVKAAGTANLYMFVGMLVVLTITSLIYTQQFSKPLLFINKRTRELSRLDFTSPLIEIKTSDEFAQLSRNINILSVNLKTTLYRLNEQNKQLSSSLERENDNEIKRRDFVNGMGHELKTPLAVIQASAEALENNVYTSDEDRNEVLVLIQKEVEKTNRMIKSMMAVYKLDSPSYEQKWEVINLKELYQEIENSLSLLYNNSKIKLITDIEDLYVLGDRDKIELVINNLFTNAIKYTPFGNKILIKIYEENNFAVFEITNFGVSILPDDLKRLFEPFYRIDKSRSRNDGSTGLGLYIVQQTLKQFDSRCVVFSSNDSVTFSFKLKKVANPLD